MIQVSNSKRIIGKFVDFNALQIYLAAHPEVETSDLTFSTVQAVDASVVQSINADRAIAQTFGGSEPKRKSTVYNIANAREQRRLGINLRHAQKQGLIPKEVDLRNTPPHVLMGYFAKQSIQAGLNMQSAAKKAEDKKVEIAAVAKATDTVATKFKEDEEKAMKAHEGDIDALVDEIRDAAVNAGTPEEIADIGKKYKKEHLQMALGQQPTKGGANKSELALQLVEKLKEGEDDEEGIEI